MKRKFNILLTGAGGHIGTSLTNFMMQVPDIEPFFWVSEREGSEHQLPENRFIKKDLKKNLELGSVVQDITKKFGKIDILINNAALTTENNVTDFASDTSDERISDVFKVNSVAVLTLIKHFLLQPEPPSLIINMLTRGAVAGAKRHIPYYASKAAILNASRCLALDYPDTRFVCTMISRVETEDKPGISIKKIEQALYDQIFEQKPPTHNFEMVYFLSTLEYVRYLFGFCIDQFRRSKNYGN